MPTPTQIKAAQAAADPFFTVHEVVDCVGSDEEGFGEEDIPEDMKRVKSTGAASPAASRRITQATFDAAVVENMSEFDMDIKSAIRAAASEFDMQGVDLEGVNIHALVE
jgi:hypothetical protein